MRMCLYTCLYLLVVVGAVVSKLDGEANDGEKGNTAQNRDTLNDANDNGTCLCAREDLLAMKDDLDSTDSIAVERGDCHLSNGRQAIRNGEVWYEVRIGTKKGWVLSRQVQTSPISSCSDNQDITPVSFATGIVSQQCLRCICLQESGCRPVGCKMDVGSLSCGYFQIKEAYWLDCKKPGKDWNSCANDITCASQCVQNYMSRYAKHFGCPLECEGFAREHNGGPRGCKSPSTLLYWQKLQNQPGCKGVK